MTCGSIAFSASRCSIPRCTSTVDRLATGMRPANGTLTPPSAPTTCSGIATLREPGETPAIGEAPNSPPPAASQVVIEIVSPVPLLGGVGLPYFPKRGPQVSPG